ncbi:hypothetical protein TNCV_1194861 [Trichonephila clavipes]|nr:hypothetical protein TNCV_1194861 [Trichonephila clavipes]
MKDGFLYNPLDHSHESNCFVSRYVSTGWILLTREAMLDLILSGISKPLTVRLHGSCQGTHLTDEMIWTVGNDHILIDIGRIFLQWKCVRPQGKLVFRSFNDLILGVQQGESRWADKK